jgi:hypothetical protein
MAPRGELNQLFGDQKMFKMIAILGLVAGGAGYGLYAHTDLFDCNGGSCSVAKKQCCSQGVSPTAVTPSCCATPCPGCETGCPDCCDDCGDCCGVTSAVSAAAKKPEASCCSAKKACCEVQDVCCVASTLASVKVAKKASCCANPCAACADGCDWCPLCEVDCSACCGLSANAAVAGPAAVAGVTKAKK